MKAYRPVGYRPVGYADGCRALHCFDAHGIPDGGCSDGPGFSISWQKGPRNGRLEVNGAVVEEVIATAMNRLLALQDGGLRCEEHTRAIVHLDEALAALGDRAQRMATRGDEGAH